MRRKVIGSIFWLLWVVTFFSSSVFAGNIDLQWTKTLSDWKSTQTINGSYDVSKGEIDSNIQEKLQRGGNWMLTCKNVITMLNNNPTYKCAEKDFNWDGKNEIVLTRRYIWGRYSHIYEVIIYSYDSNNNIKRINVFSNWIYNRDNNSYINYVTLWHKLGLIVNVLSYDNNYYTYYHKRWIYWIDKNGDLYQMFNINWLSNYHVINWENNTAFIEWNSNHRIDRDNSKSDDYIIFDWGWSIHLWSSKSWYFDWGESASNWSSFINISSNSKYAWIDAILHKKLWDFKLAFLYYPWHNDKPYLWIIDNNNQLTKYTINVSMYHNDDIGSYFETPNRHYVINGHIVAIHNNERKWYRRYMGTNYTANPGYSLDIDINNIDLQNHTIPFKKITWGEIMGAFDWLDHPNSVPVKLTKVSNSIYTLEFWHNTYIVNNGNYKRIGDKYITRLLDFGKYVVIQFGAQYMFYNKNNWSIINKTLVDPNEDGTYLTNVLWNLLVIKDKGMFIFVDHNLNVKTYNSSKFDNIKRWSILTNVFWKLLVIKDKGMFIFVDHNLNFSKFDNIKRWPILTNVYWNLLVIKDKGMFIFVDHNLNVKTYNSSKFDNIKRWPILTNVFWYKNISNTNYDNYLKKQRNMGNNLYIIWMNNNSPLWVDISNYNYLIDNYKKVGDYTFTEVSRLHIVYIEYKWKRVYEMNNISLSDTSISKIWDYLFIGYNWNILIYKDWMLIKQWSWKFIKYNNDLGFFTILYTRIHTRRKILVYKVYWGTFELIKSFGVNVSIRVRDYWGNYFPQSVNYLYFSWNNLIVNTKYANDYYWIHLNHNLPIDISKILKQNK